MRSPPTSCAEPGRIPGPARSGRAARGLLAAALLPATVLAQAPAPAAPDPAGGPGYTAEEPRAYGHRVGDVVERRLQLRLPPGLRLDPDSLPRPGRRGEALELREVSLQGPATAPRLRLAYQVFLAPAVPRTLELPPVILALEGGARRQDLRIDAWPLVVAPMTAVEPSPRRGLGELRPDAPAPRLDPGPAQRRLGLALGFAGLLLGGLLWLHLLRPWWHRRRQPCAQALRALAALPAQAVVADARPAFDLLHAALRQVADRSLLAADLPALLAERPALAPLDGELQAFFAASSELFFRPGARQAPGWDRSRLLALARQLATLERLEPAALAGSAPPRRPIPGPAVAPATVGRADAARA